MSAAQTQVSTDREDIVDLTFQYAQAVDLKDEVLLTRCFTPNIQATGSGPGPMGMGLAGGILGGPSGLSAAAFTGILIGGLRGMGATQHMFSNHRAAFLDDQHATVTFYMRAVHFARDRPTVDPYEVGGYYEHDLLRTAEGWRIAVWRLTLTWELGDPNSLVAQS